MTHAEWGYDSGRIGETMPSAKLCTRIALTGAVLGFGVTATYAATGVSGFIVVNSDGSKARGNNAKGSLRLTVGSYEADFNSTIIKCAYTGSVGLSGAGGTSPAGYLTVVARADNKKAVFVQTFNSSGQVADLGFHLEVTC
jgi:hypothetical protein